MGFPKQFHTYFSEMSLQEIDETRRGSLIGLSVSHTLLTYARSPKKVANSEIKGAELQAIYAGLQQITDALRQEGANTNYSHKMEQFHKDVDALGGTVPQTKLRLFPRVAFALLNMQGSLESRLFTIGNRLERNVAQRGPLSVPSACFEYDIKSLVYATEVSKM